MSSAHSLHSSDDYQALSHGLYIVRASRLEALLDPLELLLAATAPRDPLVPQRVVVAHPGMRHWLLQQLALRRGGRRVVAHLHVVLPSEFLDELAQAELGAQALSSPVERRSVLRWRIWRRFARFEALPQIARLSPAQRFRYADQLAGLYARYAVYRSDWLAAWKQGRYGDEDDGLQGALWRALDIEPTRAAVLQRLAALPESDAADRADVHVFGLAHLAPVESAALLGLARSRRVAVYLPDPCVESWAGLPADRAALARLDAVGEWSALDRTLLAQEHPLLARWGRLGQHFALTLDEAPERGVAIRFHQRHASDEMTRDAASTSLLGALQDGLRTLDASRVRDHLATHPQRRTDASLRIHSCHTRLRELEVLRDALLAARSELPGLDPAGIVVMAPDLRPYLPLLPAVFGRAGDPTVPLPYHLADAALATDDPRIAFLATLVDLPQQRLDRTQLTAWLQLPEIAGALGLAPDEAEALAARLTAARGVWALDAAHKAEFGVPGDTRFSLSWAMDRLLAGRVFGTAGDSDADLFDGIAAIGGSSDAGLSALEQLLSGVADWLRYTRRDRRAEAFGERLIALAQRWLRIDRDDSRARAALTDAFDALKEIGKAAGTAGDDAPIPYAVWREAAHGALTAVRESGAFLFGAITVCGMVPQRAIPYRVVAVLGLSEGDFPRGGAGVLDRSAALPRRGDRGSVDDDRYLFLETVMSARDRLHLSFLGEGVVDGKPRNPGAPLAELIDYLRLSDPDAASKPGPAWRVTHPLKASDRRYVDGSDPRLASFDAAQLALARQLAAPPAARPFLVDAEPASDDAARPEALLRRVRDFLLKPAKTLLESELGAHLPDDESQRNVEPLALRAERVERLERRLLLEALAQGLRSLPAEAPAWLGAQGLLPGGALGEDAWDRLVGELQPVLDRAACHPLYAGADGPELPAGAGFEVDVTVPLPDGGSARLAGPLGDVAVRDGATWWQWLEPGREPKNVDFKGRLDLFWHYALLRLSDPAIRRPVRLALLLKSDAGLLSADYEALERRFATARDGGDARTLAAMIVDLGARLGQLVDLYRRARREAVPYWPKTSWAAATDGDVDRAWHGDDNDSAGPGERDHAPGHARLIARGHEPTRDPRLLTEARRLAALLELATVGVAR